MGAKLLLVRLEFKFQVEQDEYYINVEAESGLNNMFLEPQEVYPYKQIKNKTPILARQPYMGQQPSQSEFEYDSIEYFSSRDGAQNRESLAEPEPTIQDWSTEGLTEDIKESLVVNLEDLVNEEYFINHISEGLHNKKSIKDYCKQWWRITEESSVKEMQVFFEEPLSKKLIKTQQILLWIFLGYIDSHEDLIYKSPKTWANLKNIINNLHRSYLVFIQFITWNLTEEQYEAAVDWAGKLTKVLETRPVMKSYYNVHNSELLKNNNNISTNLIKGLLRSKTEVIEFKKESQHILKNIDSYEVWSVRDFITASIQNSKAVKSKSTVKIHKAAKLNQWNTQKSLHRNHNTHNYDNQHFSPEAGNFKYIKNNDLINENAFNEKLKFTEQDSIELTPHKEKVVSPNYNNFVEKHMTPDISPNKSDYAPIITDFINPLITDVQDDPDDLLQLLQNSYLEEVSHESLSSDSETPLPKAPIPMSPTVSNFPKFHKEVALKYVTEPEDSQMNDTEPKYEMMQERNSQDQSIDTFIKTQGNKFFDTLNFKNLQNLIAPGCKSHEVTPSKRSNFAKSTFTPIAPVFCKKYQIRRNNENNGQMPYKTEQKQTMKKSATEQYLVKEDSSIASEILKRNTYRRNKVVSNELVKSQPKLELPEVVKDDSIINKIKNTFTPIISIIDSQISKSVERNYNKSEYRNEKPLKYQSPKSVTAPIDITPVKKEVECAKIDDSNTEIRSREKRVLITSPYNNSQNEKKESKIEVQWDQSSDTDTISLNDTKNSPNKITKFDILNEFMTPKNWESRKRAQSQENWNKDQNQSKVTEEIKQPFQSPLLNTQPKTCLTARKENKKLVESEASVDESQLNQIKLLRRLSVSKSKLPASHMPVNHDKDSESTKMLAEKLQVIHGEVSIEDVVKSEVSHDTPIPAPKFLVIDATEEEMEELARIDAELSNNTNDFNSDEGSTLVRAQNHYFIDLWRN